MKKTFIIPTIEKMDFVLSDKTMCNASGLQSDHGTFNQISQSQLGSMTN